MSKKFKWICLLLVLLLCATLVFVACKDNGEGDGTVDEDGNFVFTPGGKATSLTFWANAQSTEHGVFKAIVDKFNEQHEGQIKVTLVDRSSGSYIESLEKALNGRSGPDIFYVEDAKYKHFAESGYLYDITDKVNKSEKYNTENMWTNAVNRYLYDVDTGLSGTTSGRYYGVPKDIGPTVIFYNETAFEGAKITVISVAAEDLEAFNAGTKADDKGKTKAQYGISGTVKEKGFFEMDGKFYFNNQVPMSWEETVACASMVQTWMRAKDGGNDPLAYGYYTEWWFNYGWTVGGNVIQEIPTDDSAYNGYFWDFTLMDETPNYIVAVDEVEVNGHTYHKGETIAYTDKVNMAGYAKNSAEAAAKKNTYDVTAEVQNLKNAGKLNELPSQREAFEEFVRLAATEDMTIGNKNGYAITPNPSSLGGDSAKADWFQNQHLAMLVDGRWNVSIFRENIGASEADSNNRYYFKWDVAPLPVYKTYDANGDIAVQSVEAAGHSGSVALSINNKSSDVKKAAAWLFLEFCASIEGQTMQADAGFAIPLDKDLAASEVFLQTDKFPHNSKVFLKAAEVEQAGDWWQLPDREWIEDWANYLNGSVRNGERSIDEFYNSSQYRATFGLLDKYCRKDGKTTKT